jgi:hypothetical protein
LKLATSVTRKFGWDDVFFDFESRVSFDDTSGTGRIHGNCCFVRLVMLRTRGKQELALQMFSYAILADEPIAPWSSNITPLKQHLL